MPKRLPLIGERHVWVASVRTRILEIEGTGPPIVLLHGFTDSADSWRPVLAHLASHGRRAIAVDLPGAGHADPLPSTPVLPHYDAFVADLVRDHGDGGAVLVGNSLGALLSLRAAGRSEPPILSVVGLGPAGIEHPRLLRWIATLVCRTHPFLRVFDGIPVPEAVIHRIAAAYYARQLGAGPGDDELARRYAGHIRGMRGVARIRADMVALSRELPNDPLDLERIHVPVHLVWGQRDRLSDVRGAPAFLAAVPSASLQVLADCGHCPQVEEPRLVADIIASASSTRPVTSPHR